ncbi:unnamed protein product [Moneuplotes crassus]|uniref:Uncharacterized protein n=1 Tax=Euplotes crassus TaxID=5936 RepID=A0AAD1XML5_EUPCR|nr:unnamed protein product [Moneuplotes crassus]
MTLPNYRFNNRKFYKDLQWTEMNTFIRQEDVERNEKNDILWKKLINNSKERHPENYFETVNSTDYSAFYNHKEGKRGNDKRVFLLKNGKRNIFSPSPSFHEEEVGHFENLQSENPHDITRNLQRMKQKENIPKMNQQELPNCTSPKNNKLVNKTVISPKLRNQIKELNKPRISNLVAPSIFDRSKIAKLMEKYTFIRPSLQRYRSPDARNNTAYQTNRLENLKNNFFDLEKTKRELFPPQKKKYRPRKPALTNMRLPVRPKKKISDVSELLMESPFIKNTLKGPAKGNAKFSISDQEIERIKNQIWKKMKLSSPKKRDL